MVLWISMICYLLFYLTFDVFDCILICLFTLKPLSSLTLILILRFSFLSFSLRLAFFCHLLLLIKHLGSTPVVVTVSLLCKYVWLDLTQWDFKLAIPHWFKWGVECITLTTVFALKPCSENRPFTSEEKLTDNKRVS